MEWLLWTLAVAVLGVAAVAASGRLGELPSTVSSTPPPRLPQGLMTGDDVRRARFSVTLRGYSMQQVDELLDRVARQVDGVEPESAPRRVQE
ncbi:MAG: DivIVA domain-containing protein [Propionicimonas sp.]|uniref:DivIVA domain-containing protein n=1 Tax=Propionicimonas sp. TaxID=1955623 RepID=UPI002B1ED24E|nr:DivIVA domain-containing protein [Propionicimonas sp.]MEA4944247.1 DivIVA domain-containing protein [Propionicimonas sp.]MEA5054379.1 DivIVA domain-containing protein [Propionicimonas sp.]MEA5117272.1 DivIVA domain-containing protein [Propionicimonas sp.]